MAVHGRVELALGKLRRIPIPSPGPPEDLVQLAGNVPPQKSPHNMVSNSVRSKKVSWKAIPSCLWRA